MSLSEMGRQNFKVKMPNEVLPSAEEIQKESEKFMDEFYDMLGEVTKNGEDKSLMAITMLVEQVSKQRVMIRQSVPGTAKRLYHPLNR